MASAANGVQGVVIPWSDTEVSSAGVSLPRTQRAGAPLLKILVVDDPVLIREASHSILNGIAPVNLHASRCRSKTGIEHRLETDRCPRDKMMTARAIDKQAHTLFRRALPSAPVRGGLYAGRARPSAARDGEAERPSGPGLIIIDLCGLQHWQVGRLLLLRIRPV
jgi:hypothetical protein